MAVKLLDSSDYDAMTLEELEALANESVPSMDVMVADAFLRRVFGDTLGGWLASWAPPAVVIGTGEAATGVADTVSRGADELADVATGATARAWLPLGLAAAGIGAAVWWRTSGSRRRR